MEPDEAMAKDRRVEPRLARPSRSRRSGDLDLRLTENDRAAGRRPAARTAKPAGSGGAKTARSAPPRGRRRTARRARGKGRFRLLRRIVKTGFFLFLVAFVGGIAVVGYYASQLPSVTSWAVPERPPNIKIVSADGALIGNRGDTGGETVRLGDLPPYLAQAVVASEDRRFYSHFGVDPLGVARIALNAVRSGSLSAGASTITQQLARTLFLTLDRTVERKIQEAILAVWLEARYSKDEILEMYLNRVYLGAGAYGVDAASRKYFGKPAGDVTLAEASILAGILPAPGRYAPTVSVEAARRRGALVLGLMADQGYITAAEATAAEASRLGRPQTVAGGSTGYIADWVADLVPGFVGAIDDDIVVATTIDMRLQDAAARAVTEGLAEEGQALGASQGALVAMEANGAVRALVGGRDYGQSQFNRAVNARRQPGSAFKPFVYLTALEYGLTPETIRVDQRVTIDGWSPENYSREFAGPVTLQSALARSLNTVAAQLAHEVGPANVVATARRLGITAPLQPNPSIALGTSEVTLLDLTGAYAPFANGGAGVIPHVIQEIRTQGGRLLYQRAGSGPGQVIHPDRLGMMNAMLHETLATGTGRKAVVEGWEAAGKTGTSQEWRDAWFVGYTAHMVTGVWFGNDNGRPTEKASGGNLPAVVWTRFMAEAHRDVAVAALPGDYVFRDPSRFAVTAPPQDLMPRDDALGRVITENGRYDEYLNRMEPRAADVERFQDRGWALPEPVAPAPVAGPGFPGAGIENMAPGGGQEADRFDPGPAVPAGAPLPAATDPRLIPNGPPRFGGPVPPADIGGGFPVAPTPQPRPPGLLGRLFGG